MKKLLSILLTFVMVFSFMGMTASAAQTPETGSITVNGVDENTTYNIYKLLDLESYDTSSGAYSYKANSAWEAFFGTADAKTYVDINTQGYVTWKAGDDATKVADFAKKALAYAKENNIYPVKSSENSGDMVITETSGKFSDLELGYYLIDSSAGALCGLTTTNPHASINAKNGIPTISKQVKEDSTGQWDTVATADIGQVVDYRVTINVHAGAENYVLHDYMGDGLTFNNVTKIEHVVPSTNKTTTVPAEYYEVKTENLETGCDFEVHFTQAFCEHLVTNDKVIVYYEVMLNRNAVIAGDGNTNIAKLDFAEGKVTNESSATIKTFGIDLVKTDSQNKLIDGAEFRIYDAQTDGNEVKVVLMDDGETYRRARTDEEGVNIVVKDGKVRIVGFDNGTYWLEEKVTPNGYNKLEGRQSFTISDANLYAVFNGETFSTGSGVHVVNKTGTMLPETGSMGTTAFVAFGSIVALATGVLLVTKKRMSMIDD